ncbi:MAG: hypothetical protein WBJ68_14105 [Candidatus Dechloromonas phosphoritropha]|jgi:hypothetical protein
MTPEVKRRLFPLRAPRLQSRAFLPWHIVAAAVDGYFEAFFMLLPPPSAPTSPVGDVLNHPGNPRRGDSLS